MRVLSIDHLTTDHLPMIEGRCGPHLMTICCHDLCVREKGLLFLFFSFHYSLIE